MQSARVAFEKEREQLKSAKDEASGLRKELESLRSALLELEKELKSTVARYEEASRRSREARSTRVLGGSWELMSTRRGLREGEAAHERAA